MTYKTQTDILGQFIIVEDGCISEAVIDEQERNVRIELLHAKAREIGREMVQGTISGLITTAKFAGSATLELFEAVAEAGKATA